MSPVELVLLFEGFTITYRVANNNARTIDLTAVTGKQPEGGLDGSSV